MRDELWRWRRNPLKRRSDRAEAWVVLAAGVLPATGAPTVGALTALSVEDGELRQSQDRHHVSAVLTENAPTVGDVSIGTDNGRVRATARWTASDGSSATGKGLVEPGSETGSRTTVWLDRQGALNNAPATPGQAMAAGIVFGTFAAGGTCLLVLGGRWAVRARLDRRRDAEWENGWALVGPQWGHRRA